MVHRQANSVICCLWSQLLESRLEYLRQWYLFSQPLTAFFFFSELGIKLGAFAYQASSLPLSHVPSPSDNIWICNPIPTAVLGWWHLLPRLRCILLTLSQCKSLASFLLWHSRPIFWTVCWASPLDTPQAPQTHCGHRRSSSPQHTCPFPVLTVEVNGVLILQAPSLASA
jgi:hypothetical protein